MFRETVIPDYAVTSNGGNILVNGAVDEEWRKRIGEKVLAESAPEGDVRSLVLAALREEWIISERWCDGLFYTYVVHRDLIPIEVALELSEKLYGLGWRVSLQGRKLYAVPAAVNKSDAIAHVRRTVEASRWRRRAIRCWTGACWTAPTMPSFRRTEKSTRSGRTDRRCRTGSRIRPACSPPMRFCGM